MKVFVVLRYFSDEERREPLAALPPQAVWINPPKEILKQPAKKIYSLELNFTKELSHSA